MIYKYKVELQQETTLENYLKNSLNFSARLIRRLKRPPCSITRNGIIVRTIDTVHCGDEIVVQTEDLSETEANPSLYAEKIFENDDFVCYNKPSGMAVHPSHRHRDDTLGNLFASQYAGLTFRPVNRLDRDTSGCCVVAKSQQAAANLQNKLKKVYYAVTEGCTPEKGTIDKKIARQSDTIILRCISENGQRAVTHYKKIGGNEKISFLEIQLETGRTHQIRVHFSSEGFPLCGDDLYGGSDELIKRQALHCGKILIDGEEIVAKLPDDINRLLSENGII